jgi:hypothetical protein
MAGMGREQVAARGPWSRDASDGPTLTRVFVRIDDRGVVNRGDKLAWAVRHANQVVVVADDEVSRSCEDTAVVDGDADVSVVWRATRLVAVNAVDDTRDDARSTVSCGRVTRETEVVFYGQTYNLLLHLDLNLSSMAVRAAADGAVLAELVRSR